MPTMKLVPAVLLIAVSVASGVLIAHGAAASAAARHVFTLRAGDRVVVPSVGQTCTVESEGGAPELFCSRPSAARHQVVFFRDMVFVWKVGDPDKPAWAGKP